MQEISGSLVDQKMSLVLCNFNGFAKTIKKPSKTNGKMICFDPRASQWRLPFRPKIMAFKKCHWSLLISMVLRKPPKNHWKYVTFRMGKLVRNENVEIHLFFKAKAKHRHT